MVTVGPGTKGANVGGLVGLAGEHLIRNAYAEGPVTTVGLGAAGGLVGQQVFGSIVDTYATGPLSVEGASSMMGGLVGSELGGRIIASFFERTAHAPSSGIGQRFAFRMCARCSSQSRALGPSSVGAQPETLRHLETLSLYTAADHARVHPPWNFKKTWALYRGRNRGLPVLRALSTPVRGPTSLPLWPVVAAVAAILGTVGWTIWAKRRVAAGPA
jgi:hypothetical protein